MASRSMQQEQMTHPLKLGLYDSVLPVSMPWLWTLRALFLTAFATTAWSCRISQGHCKKRLS